MDKFSFFSKVLLLTIAAAFVFADDSAAQLQYPILPPSRIDFEHYSTRNGLSNPVVYDIVQDQYGFLWFATGSGVSRYNGYEFINYLPDDGPGSIGKGPVLKLYIDDQQRLWVISLGGGVYRYDGNHDNFIAYDEELFSPENLPCSNIYSMTQDDSGVFWFTSLGYGLIRFDEKTKKTTHFRHDPEKSNSIVSDHLVGILKDSQNYLWISTKKNGVMRFDPDSGRYTHYLHGKAHAINMIEDRYNDIWIPTLGDGLYRFVARENRIVSYLFDENKPGGISHNQVVKVFEDRGGLIWITTWGGGLNVYDRERDRFTAYKKQVLDPGSLSNNDTWGIFEDNTGVMWVGTYGSGVNKYDRKKERFSRIKHDPFDKNSLSHSSVKAIYEDSHGIMWLGTLGGGLTSYDRSKNVFRHYRHDPAEPGSLGHDRVWAIDEDKDGDLWIATENGLDRYERSDDRFTHYRHDPKDSNSLSENLIRSVMVDDLNRVWAGNQFSGFDRFDRRRNRFVRYRTLTGHNIVSFQDSTGTIWAGGLYLFRFDETQDRFVTAGLRSGNKSDQAKDFYTVIKEDRNQNLWMGTTSGLYQYDRDHKILKSYSLKEGLSDTAIAGLLMDDKGQVWVSTARGVSVITPGDSRIRNYDLGGEYNRDANCVTKDGMLHFGGLNGLTSFSPDKVKDNPHIPQIAITSFKKFNKEVSPGESLNKFTDLTLSYKDSFFSFEFSALDFSQPERNQYRYKLHGFDEEWIHVDSTRRFASYTNLDAGNYTFQVTGSNNDDTWNKKGRSIDITITPPWWESLWFTFLVFSLVTMGIICSLLYMSRLRFEIRERRHAEKEVKAVAARFSKHIDNTPLGVIEWNPDFKVTLWNRSAERIFGYSREEAIGKHPMELILSSEDLSDIQKVWQDLLNGKGGARSTNRNITKHGEAITCEWYNTPLSDGSGRVIGVASIIQDITEQLNFEKEKAKLSALLQQSQKMEAIGTLAGGIAHDFNNLLFPIIGYSEILCAGFEKGSKTYEQAIGVHKAALRARDLVKQILTFSHQNRHTQKHLPVQLQPILREVLKLLRSTIPRTIEIQDHIDRNCGRVVADPTQIHQVVLNLATNAYHAMQVTGGQMTVRLEQTRMDVIAAKYLDLIPGWYALITVSDTGTGIKKEILDKIFDPYFSTKVKGKGTGLGLSVVQGIVRNSKGNISIQSEPDRGTQVLVYLPVHTESSAGETGSSREQVPKGSEKILLVDDESDVLEIEILMLERLGYKVVSTTSPAQAVDLLKENPNRFDLVISDMTMPKMTGVQLSNKLKLIRQDIPVIICTGFSDHISRDTFREYGIQGYVAKPVIELEMATTIRNVLDKK